MARVAKKDKASVADKTLERMEQVTESLEEQADKLNENLRKRRRITPIPASDFLSTGSTVLNLACTGRINGGFVKGKVYRYIGASGSGKTFLTLTCFAEASLNKNFKGYRYIHDNVEDGSLMDLEAFFGKSVSDKIEAPNYSGDVALFSETAEDFYNNVEKAIDKGIPFIYVLDSTDALDSDSSRKKDKKNANAAAKGAEQKGSYGDGKAKINSSRLRRLIPGLRKTGSILIMISQTRDNIGFNAMFNPEVVSGGRSLKFYATLEMWMSVMGSLKRKVGEKDRKIGMISKIEVKKNRVTGRDWTVYVPIYHSVGIDDLGGCIDFLVEEGHWKKKNKSDDDGKRKDANKGSLIAPEFDHEGTKEKLIQMIEDGEREQELKILVKEVFNNILDGCEVRRKVKYL